MFAYDKQGTVFAMREGAELLAHDGPSEGPLWRKTLDADIVGLGADSKRIGAVTASGMVAWFAARTGEMELTVRFEAAIERAVVDAKAQRAIGVTANKILVATGNDIRTLADHGARAIALKPDGTLLAATTELVTITPDGTRTATPFPHTDIRALAWHPAGFWIVATQRVLYRWDGTTASHITQLPEGSELAAVAATDKAIAIMFDGDHVASLAWPSLETLGSVHYLDRKAEGIDFGPWPWLGIAMDLGDGNKHNLDEPDRLHRSDTHPGREHHNWLVKVGGGSEKKAKPPAPTPVAKPASSMRFVAPVLILLVVVLYALLR